MTPNDYLRQLRIECDPLTRKMLSCKTDWSGHQMIMAGLETAATMLDSALQTPEPGVESIDRDALVIGWINMALFSLSRVVDGYVIMKHLRGYIAQQDKLAAERAQTRGEN